MPGKPRDFRLLLLGLGATVCFFMLYFGVAIALGWQHPAAWEPGIGEVSRWCERVYPGVIREPVNALSNLGFIAAGLWMLWVMGRDGPSTRSDMFKGQHSVALIYAGAVWFLGPGSLVMHGTHAAWAGWLDNLSMVMYILIPWMINLTQLGRFSITQFLWSYFSIVALYGLLRGYFGWGLGINLDLFGLSIALWIISESLYRFWSPWFRWASGLVGFIVAGLFGMSPLMMMDSPEKYWWVVFFWLPAIFAKQPPERKRRYVPWFFSGVILYLSAFAIWQTGKTDHPACDPDSVFQAHGLWHLMTALATICFFVFLRSEHEIRREERVDSTSHL